MAHSAVDFQDPVATPVDLSIRRTYQSKVTSSGLFGQGWFSLFTIRLEFPPNSLVRFRDSRGQGWAFAVLPDPTGPNPYVSINSATKSLLKNSDGTFLLTDSVSGSTYQFSPGGVVTSITNASGQSLIFAYDGSGNLARVTDSVGRFLAFTVSQGAIQTIAENGVTIVSYGYTGGQLTSASFPDGTSKIYSYALQGNGQVLLTQINDEQNRLEAKWTYDSTGRATSSSGPGGNELFGFSYSPNRVTDGFNRATTYTQDAAGLRVSGISGPGCPSCGDSTVVNVTYDAQERIQSATDRRGTINQYQGYDTRGNPQTVVEAAGTSVQRTTAYTYHPGTDHPLSRSTQSVVDSSKTKTVIWDYDADYNSAFNEAPTGLLHQKIEQGLTRDIGGNIASFQYVTTYHYDSLGRLSSIDGPRSAVQDVTSFTYDSATGALRTITTPSGITTFSNFDSVGRPRTVTDPNLNAANLVYDARGRLTQSTDGASGAVTKYAYDAAGKLTKITLPNLNALTFVRAANGEVQTITDSLGNKISYSYDAMNNRNSVQLLDPQGTLRRSLSLSFNKSTDPNWPGLLWHLVKSDLSFTELSYDPNANVGGIIDPDGNVTNLVSDPLNRLSTVTQVATSGNAVTSYGYDTNGTATSVTDAEGRVTTFETDDLGRVTKATSPDTGITRYSYGDDPGNLVYKLDAAGNLINYSYDASNRLSAITAPDQTITFTYDETDVTNGKGHLTRAVDASGTTRYGYDSLGRVTSDLATIGGIVYTTAYSYDPNGNLKQLTLPSGDKVLYDYDLGDHISRIRFQRSGSAQAVTLADQITWMPFGPLQSWTYGNGLTAFRRYDLDYQVSEIDEGNLWRTYQYNHSGDINGITLAVSEPSGSAQPHTTYAYQSGTNLISSSTPTGQSVTLYNYDARGNITAYGSKTLVYDCLGRLTSVLSGGPQIGAYSYNFRDQRVKKVAAGVTTVYHYDLAGNLIEETDAAGNLQKEYVHLGSNLGSMPLAMVTPNDLDYYHVDHLGTPIRMTDGSQRTVWEAGYSAFGVASWNENPDGDGTTVTSNLRLPGQYFDAETGLNYNWHRYYAPELGRYLQPDPLADMPSRPAPARRGDIEPTVDPASVSVAALSMSLESPLAIFRRDTPSPYPYVANAPLNLTDPEGLHFLPAPGGRCIPHRDLPTGGVVADSNCDCFGNCPQTSQCDIGGFLGCLTRRGIRQTAELRTCVTMCELAAATRAPGAITACCVCIAGAATQTVDCAQDNQCP
jgi:RHS repeat-associated protein